MDEANEPNLAATGAFSAQGEAAELSLAANGMAAPAKAVAGATSDVVLPEGYLGGAE